MQSQIDALEDKLIDLQEGRAHLVERGLYAAHFETPLPDSQGRPSREARWRDREMHEVWSAVARENEKGGSLPCKHFVTTFYDGSSCKHFVKTFRG